MTLRTPLAAALCTSVLSLSAFSITVSPVQAAPDCATSGMGGSSNFLIPDLQALGPIGCQFGDKVYSDFVFNGGTAAWGSTGLFGFANTSGQELTFYGSNLELLPGILYNYSYRVTVVSPASEPIYSYNTNFDGSPIASFLAASKTLANNINGDESTATKGPDAVGGNVQFFLPQSMVHFNSTITVTAGRIDSITDSVKVPGPLPILGAGAALGLSRKLRARMKS